MSLADTTCGGVWDELSAWLSSTCTAEGSPWNWHARDHAPGQQTARETPNNSSRCTHRPRNKMRGAEEVQGEQATGARAGRVSLCTAGRQLRWAAGCGLRANGTTGSWALEGEATATQQALVGEKEGVVLLAGAFTAGRSDSRSCSLRLRLPSSWPSGRRCLRYGWDCWEERERRAMGHALGRGLGAGRVLQASAHWAPHRLNALCSRRGGTPIEIPAVHCACIQPTTVVCAGSKSPAQE